jgi:hypothetical protein
MALESCATQLVGGFGGVFSFRLYARNFGRAERTLQSSYHPGEDVRRTGNEAGSSASEARLTPIFPVGIRTPVLQPSLPGDVQLGSSGLRR